MNNITECPSLIIFNIVKSHSSYYNPPPFSEAIIYLSVQTHETRIRFLQSKQTGVILRPFGPQIIFQKQQIIFYVNLDSRSRSSLLSVFRIRIRSDPYHLVGSGSDPYQEALIWIRVAPKDYSGKKSIFLKFLFFLLHFARFRNI